MASIQSPTSARVLTPARVVALAVISVLVAGLVYLRLASDAGPVSVPADAQAGDLVLEACEYEGESSTHPADCGTLVVPENRADAASRLIALPVTRVLARSDEPKEPVFFLTGGPGQSNMDFELADRYADNHDVVLVGYRGIDGSERLECPEVDSAIKRTTDLLSDDFFRAYAQAYRTCADRLIADGIDVTGYGLVQQVDDLEDARVALGYGRINLLSESAGTRTAMIYAWRHPESIHRSVMIGVNPPGAFLWDADTTDEQIGRFAALCAADATCRSRTDDLAATMRRTADDIPDRWLFLRIKDSNVRVVSLFGLFETASTGQASAPMMIDAWLSAAEGDASGLWVASVIGDLLLSDLFVRGQYASAAMLDAQAARDYFADGPGDLSNLGRAATASGWGGGRMADAWPPAPDEDEYRRVRPSDVETLLIGGALDVSTPPQVARRALLPYLPNGQAVVLPGFGHTGSFFGEQPEAGTRLVSSFFDSGRADTSLYRPQRLDFTPPRTFGAVARTVLGLMLGLAALTVLSLLVMARWVRRNGHVRPEVGAVLRSFYAFVLGLGGWCLGALVVLATMPGVRIDNQLLVLLSVGVAVGLAIYWTWVHRDWAVRDKRAGLATAAAGALGGAWLGFHAMDGGFSLVTATAGAVVGANLTLILFDIVRARSAPTEPPAPRATDKRAAGSQAGA